MLHPHTVHHLVNWHTNTLSADSRVDRERRGCRAEEESCHGGEGGVASRKRGSRKEEEVWQRGEGREGRVARRKRKG